mmetsp:Transcript_1098/g.3336  ORF Transcript_1098/g.3336 Transcript_1098/m.3336 type:complete len:213 (-) Transcript_1098:196-834(-)
MRSRAACRPRRKLSSASRSSSRLPRRWRRSSKPRGTTCRRRLQTGKRRRRTRKATWRTTRGTSRTRRTTSRRSRPTATGSSAPSSAAQPGAPQRRTASARPRSSSPAPPRPGQRSSRGCMAVPSTTAPCAASASSACGEQRARVPAALPRWHPASPEGSTRWEERAQVRQPRRATYPACATSALSMALTGASPRSCRRDLLAAQSSLPALRP